jgi:histidinol dehydrogenase
MPRDESWTDDLGATLGWRWTPVSAAGLYVPGGLASYPSSVLMNAIPAKVAGVSRLAVTVPTPDGIANPLVLLACRIAGVDEVFRIGGAQAIAALAYGTETIRPVDKITGPGNAYVAAAKRRVFGRVGIDMIAGPSEILVIADRDNDPDWVAIDLLSQAEHDESAQAILITDHAPFGRAVAQAVERRLETLPRAAIAGASWREHGAIVTVRDLAEAARLADRIAAEHLEILVADPEALAARITHAGAMFLGPWTPEAIGDYIGGPNHVLPTARTARFSSGLSVMDFLKRTTSRSSPPPPRRLGPAAETLAKAERWSSRPVRPRPPGPSQPMTERLSPSISTTAAAPRPARRSSRSAASPFSTFSRPTASRCPPATAAPPGVPGSWRWPYAKVASSSPSPPKGRSRGRVPHVARPLPAGGQGLRPDLRQLLRGRPHPAARPDRDHRHGPPRHPQRRRPHPAGAPRRQGHAGPGHGAAALHADLRPAMGGPVTDQSPPPKATDALPQSVLFCCDHNAVRSPMAEGIMKKLYGIDTYVQSAGVRNDLEIDGFAIAVCQEIGVELSRHRSRSFDEMRGSADDLAAFDLIVALTPASQRARSTSRGSTRCMSNTGPSSTHGLGEGRDERLASYRQTRDMILARILDRWGPPKDGSARPGT